MKTVSLSARKDFTFLLLVRTVKVETAYMTWLNEGGNLKTDAEKATYKSDLYKAVFGEEAQGDDDQSGQRGVVGSYSQKTGLTRT